MNFVSIDIKFTKSRCWKKCVYLHKYLISYDVMLWNIDLKATVERLCQFYVSHRCGYVAREQSTSINLFDNFGITNEIHYGRANFLCTQKSLCESYFADRKFSIAIEWCRSAKMPIYCVKYPKYYPIDAKKNKILRLDENETHFSRKSLDLKNVIRDWIQFVNCFPLENVSSSLILPFSANALHFFIAHCF